MSDLSAKHCTVCEGGAPALDPQQQTVLRDNLDDAWDIVGGRLKRTFKFKDFKQALEFTNRVGNIAEQEGHHPNICLTYGSVTIEIWTHSVNALTENDFILAAKIDRI